MLLLALSRQVLLRIASRPIAWLWLAFSLCLWLLALELSPVGLTSSSSGATPIVYEVAFLSQLVGTALACAVLAEGSWFLAQVSPARRVSARAVGLLAGGAAGLVLGLTGPALTSLIGRGPEITWGWLLLGAALCQMHLAALGLLLLFGPLPDWLRALGLPLVAWLIPAALGARGALGAFARRALDAAQHLEPEALRTTSTGLGAGVAPILGLLACALLLEHGLRSLRRTAR